MANFEAKVISFGISALTLSVSSILTMIRIVKFYVAKTVMIDPPMPWGEDERLGIKTIRISWASLSIGILSIQYAIGMYPNWYYLFTIGYHTSLYALKFTSTIDRVLKFIMVVSCVLLFLGEKYYRSINKKTNDPNIPRQMDYFTWIILLTILFSFLLHSLGALQIFKPTTRLEFWQVSMTITLVLPPAIVILRTEQLKSYAIRTLKDIQYEAFLLQIYLTPAFLMLLINGILYLC